MEINILTLFPEMFTPLNASIMGRAQNKGLVDMNVVDIRPYAEDPRIADDTVYGGGAGMVLKPEPIMEALKSQGWQKGDKVIVTTPAGRRFNQREAIALAKEPKIFVIAGHYEGIDQRVAELTEAEEYSIGDYVLTGGELPAMVMVDSVVRLVDGVLGTGASLEQESFSQGLLEYPQYTKPREYMGLTVPDVLLCGDHMVIDAWRRKESIKRTCINRPELLWETPLSDEEEKLVSEYKDSQRSDIDVYITLVHYPVYDPKGHVIATSVTNLDIHDIARLGRTYNVRGYYIVQPGEEQKALTEKVVNYWTRGHGGKVNPDRKEALDRVKVVDSLKDAVAAIEAQENRKVLTIGTSAKSRDTIIGYQELRQEMARRDNPFLLVFGTGYGLTDEIMDSLDYVVKPIEGRGEYNHLSVRSAVSVTLDRLVGER